MPKKPGKGEKIKVLHVITRLIIGGAQENTLFTVEGLMKDDRFEAALVTGPPLGPEGSLIERARKNGVDMTLIPEMRREINPFLDLVTFIKLYRFLKRKRYDIVHTHSAKAGVLGRFAARLAGVPLVIHTVHGLSFHSYQNRLLNFLYANLERLAGRFSDFCVCVGEVMLRQAVAAGVCTAGRTRVIYSGIELEKYESGRQANEKERLGIAPDAPVVGKIARLFHLKGHEHLLRAAAAVKKEFPGVRFILVGDGILKDDLKRQAGELGIEENVIFAGLAEPDRIPSLINTMDVLVHVSFREGLPKAAVQALAAGKPVVAFAVDGAPEVVIEGKTGHLVPPADEEKLAEAVIDLLKNRGRAKKWGEEGRRIIREKFDVDLMVQRLKELYLELLLKTKNGFKD